MAGSRKPGPLGGSGKGQDLDDGTSIRGLSPRPGPVGSAPGPGRKAAGETAAAARATPPARRKAASQGLKALRVGSRGLEVRKLQRLLNVRLSPSPRLAVDGIFGPLTLQGVRLYQAGVSIAIDGIVGKRTWYHLLKGDTASIPPPAAPKPPAAPPPQPAAVPSVAESIWEWPLRKKLLAVVERVPRRLGGRARSELEALLQPESLALSLAIIAGFCLLSGGHRLGERSVQGDQ